MTAGYGLARRFDDEVTVNAVHPGIVATDVIDDLIPRALRPFRALIRSLLLAPEEGAAAALRLATDPGLHGVTGLYFVRSTEATTPAVSYDQNVQDRLLAASDRLLRSDTRRDAPPAVTSGRRR